MDLNSYLINYDSTRSNLKATTIQDAIDNLRDSTIVKTILDAGVDLNTIFEDGFYAFPSSAKNSPFSNDEESTYKYGTLIVTSNFRFMTTQYCLLNNKRKNIVYFRQFNRNDINIQNTWSTWDQFLDYNSLINQPGVITNNEIDAIVA